MPPVEPHSPKSSDERLMEVEVQLSHLQRQYEQINQVVTEQALEVDRLRAVIRKLNGTVQDLKSKEPDRRDPLDEKPPHY